MCGGIYEEDFDEATPRTDKQVSKTEKRSDMESGDGGMNDLKFTTAADFINQQEDDYNDPYCYPGSDPQE